MTSRLRQGVLATAFAASLLSLSGAPGVARMYAPPTTSSPTSVTPSSAPSSVPAGTPASAAPAAPVQAPVATSPVPAPTATPAYHFVYTHAPDVVTAPTPPGTPQILEIDLTDKTIITPQLVHMRVLTTPEVQSVKIAAMGYTLALSQLGPGLFSAEQQLPKMPFFFRNHTVPVQIVAQVNDGRNDAVTIPVVLR